MFRADLGDLGDTGQHDIAGLQCGICTGHPREGIDVADGYGTIYRMRPKPGAEPQLVALLEEWERERKPNARGAIGGYLFKPDGRPDELIGVAVFRDRESYRANASDPAPEAVVSATA